ncbi:MAG: 1-acyl-sn-glycerol-3-phosphate acyltransferase, partial [Chloroflexaceae bacterium]|nr:1-acyl-sn-glycerol-3-phosphate acyltransferase [Chloroflexaceae bacterium]
GMGGFPVDTERPRPGSFRHSVELLLKNRMVVIFPEGNIFRDRQVHPLKRGLARIAIEAATLQPDSQLKILPVGIHYSQPYPQWGTEVTVTIGKPLTVGDYQDPSPRKRSQDLTAALTTSLQALQAECEPDEPELVAAN